MNISKKDIGVFMLRVARQAIEKWVTEGKRLVVKEYPNELNEKRGVFVTIYKEPGKVLRGCIGCIDPEEPLIDNLIDMAISATRDYRFSELKKSELDKIRINVSVLTRPELIKVDRPKDYIKKINIGKDGLIVGDDRDHYRGVLLPEVAVEHVFSPEDFLDCVCWKAGMPEKTWRKERLNIYKFQTEIYKE